MNAELYEDGFQAEAAAVASLHGCPANAGCAYVTVNYGGRRGQFFGTNATWGSFSNSSCPDGSWKNCASSAVNNKAPNGDRFHLNKNINFQGTAFVIDGDAAASYLGTFDNDVEANEFW